MPQMPQQGAREQEKSSGRQRVTPGGQHDAELILIERIFETKIPPATLETRAKRAKAKLGSNEPNDPTAENDNERSGNSGNIEDEPGIDG